jgi:hypothetical protein
MPLVLPRSLAGARSLRPWPSCQGSRSDRLRLGLDSAGRARTIKHRGDGTNPATNPTTYGEQPRSSVASRPGAQDAPGSEDRRPRGSTDLCHGRLGRRPMSLCEPGVGVMPAAMAAQIGMPCSRHRSYTSSGYSPGAALTSASSPATHARSMLSPFARRVRWPHSPWHRQTIRDRVPGPLLRADSVFMTSARRSKRRSAASIEPCSSKSRSSGTLVSRWAKAARASRPAHRGGTGRRAARPARARPGAAARSAVALTGSRPGMSTLSRTNSASRFTLSRTPMSSFASQARGTAQDPAARLAPHDPEPDGEGRGPDLNHQQVGGAL